MTSRRTPLSMHEAKGLKLHVNDVTPLRLPPPALCAAAAPLSALEDPKAFFAAHALDEPPPDIDEPARQAALKLFP